MDDWKLEQLRAIADPTRLRIVALLRGRGETCVCEILAALGTSQSNISAHLRILRLAGLIRGRKDGKWVHYTLDDAAVVGLLDALNEALRPVEPSAVACCDVETCCTDTDDSLLVLNEPAAPCCDAEACCAETDGPVEVPA